MAITDAQYEEWLDDDTAQPVTLYHLNCTVGGVATVRRLSNKLYQGGTSASPYLAVINEDLEIAQEISMDSDFKMSIGEIVVDNPDGEFDSWLDDAWSNQLVEVLVGDLRWPVADFRVQYVLTMDDINGGDDDQTITFKFMDILQRMNAPVSEFKLTNDVFCPVSFGEVPNMSPKLDPATNKWYYHKGASEGIIEVRTDGKRRLSPNDITDTPSGGYFQFNTNVGPGLVTCDVQGDKTGGVYRNTISALIQMLVTNYGKADTRFVAGDLDATNLAAFEAANPQPVGLGLTDRTNVLVACARLARSKGAQMLPSRLGKLRLIQYAIPTVSTRDITLAMQYDKPLVLVNRTKPRASVNLGFCRNYTPQPGLGTSLPPAHKQMFADEWRTHTEKDDATALKYKTTVSAIMEETELLKRTDVVVEAQRRLAIVKVPRFTFRTELNPLGLLLDIGQAVKLFGVRYSLSAGKVGLVTRLVFNFGTYRTTAEVTI
jgi:hypothetical protein